MLRSLFAGVSGLRNHQFRMDVIGNNIANVNTVSFKSGRVTFKEGFAQLLQGASRPPGDQGGVNPVQVGLGSLIGSVDQLFTQGNVETTGVNTDIAMQGDAFFVVRKGTETYYTRSGNFQLDAEGRMVSPTNGFIVQGRMALDGILNDTITDITLPFGQKVAARATSKVTVAGNLNSSAGIFNDTDPDGGGGPLDGGFGPDTRAVPANAGTFTNGTIGMFDALGNKVDVKMWMWKTDPNQWDWQIDETSLPAGYVLDPVAIPRMGVHGGASNAPELRGAPFASSFIYGFYDGDMIFLEPMMTRAFLLSRPDTTISIVTPARYPKPGAYPTAYAYKYDSATRERRIELRAFVQRN